MSEDIRWEQRFRNFDKAFQFLKKSLEIEKPSKIEQAGIVQAYEFTFELAWKTLKDYLAFNEVEAKFPRDVIKQAFKYELLSDGDTWMDMLEKRNLMTHTYNETNAKLAQQLIRNKYYSTLTQLHQLLTDKAGGSQ